MRSCGAPTASGSNQIPGALDGATGPQRHGELSRAVLAVVLWGSGPAVQGRAGGGGVQSCNVELASPASALSPAGKPVQTLLC